MSKHRVEAFSDGVFAIAITLLVLTIEVPKGVISDRALWRAVLDQWPNMVAYAISFGIIGVYWVGHHLMFHYIRHVDRLFLFLNNLYLMIIAFMPFPASLLGRFGASHVSVVIYASTLIVAGMLYANLWRYATKNHRLVDPRMSEKLIHLVTKIITAAPIIYLVAIGLSFVNPRWCLIVFVIVPLLYIVPGPIDKLMMAEEAHIQSLESPDETQPSR